MNAGNEKLFTAVKPFKIIQTTENSINVIFLNIIIFVRGGHCKYSPLAPHPPSKKKSYATTKLYKISAFTDSQ